MLTIEVSFWSRMEHNFRLIFSIVYWIRCDDNHSEVHWWVAVYKKTKC
jgi:hypothetical protein